MIAAVAITVLGLLLGIGIVQRTGLRVGGVIVVPLLAVYSLYTIAALPLFVLSTVIAYIGVGLIRNRTLIHGRQLLLASLGVGVTVPLISTVVFEIWPLFDSLAEIAFIGTILPGIAAYNFHKIGTEDRLTDIAVSFGVLGGLMTFGAALVNPTLATSVSPGLTSILFTPSSDIAQFNGAVRGAVATATFLPREPTVLLLLAGLVASESAHSRWGVRTGGLIAVPLLVVLALTNVWTIPVYLAGLAVVYGAINLIHRQTLLYGRVLLSLGLVVSMLYVVVVAAVLSTVTGFLLYFTAILAGVGAYNYHMVAPAERLESAALAAGLFSALIAVTRVLVEPTEVGALATVSSIHIVVLGGSVIGACYAMYRLEQRRRPVARHHSRGVNI